MFIGGTVQGNVSWSSLGTRQIDVPQDRSPDRLSEEEDVRGPPGGSATTLVALGTWISLSLFICLLYAVSHIFSTFQSYERMNLADALVTKTFQDGEIIVNQGDVGDGMYFVEEGQVSISMHGKDGIERTASRDKDLKQKKKWVD